MLFLYFLIDKKRRIIIVLEEKPTCNPFDCPIVPRCLTSFQLEPFCTNVRLAGGVTITDVKPATAQGILEHDVDVTAGNATGTVIVAGWVNENRLPSAVTINDTVKKALTGVHFFKRNA